MRFTTKQAIPYLSFFIAFGLLLGVSYAFTGGHQANQDANATCKGNHKTQWSLYEDLGMLPPVEISSIEGNHLEWTHVEQGIHIGSLELEPGYSIVPRGLSADSHNGCYGITYCKRHMTVLRIDELPPQACKGVKP